MIGLNFDRKSWLFSVSACVLLLGLGIRGLSGCAAPPDAVPTVSMRTSLGVIEIELYPAAAPRTVANFLRYVDNKAYAGGQFYRVVRLDNQVQNDILIEVVQGGLGDNNRDRELPPIGHETTQQTGLLHLDGSISLARGEPGTGSSEFFICIGDQPALDFGGKRNSDGAGFAAFGRVTKGMDVVRAIHGLQTHAPVAGKLDYTSGQILVRPVEIISVDVEGSRR